jgi:chromosome segregation ATPase
MGGFTMIRSRKAMVIALAASIPMLALAAASPDKAEKVAEKMLQFDKALATAQAQIDTTLQSMNALKEGSDLVGKYKDFSKQVDNLDKMSQKAKSNAEKAGATRDQYIAEMQKSSESIQNPQLKASAEARRAELQPKIEAIKSNLGSARDTFTPFMQDLKDLKVFLASQLNPAGITAASDLMAKCNEAGGKVKADVGKESDAVKDLAATIQPGGGAK